MTMTMTQHRRQYDPHGVDARETAIGSAIKSIGRSSIGGHLIVWNSIDRSRMRDMFLPSVKLGRLARGPLDVYMGHALLGGIDDQVVGEATLKPDGHGLAIFADLDTSLKVSREAIDSLKTDPGALSWSSGAVVHLIRRKQERDHNVVLSWPLAEASLVAVPAEPKAIATLAPERKTVSADDPIIRQARKHIDAQAAEDARVIATGLRHVRAYQADADRDGRAAYAAYLASENARALARLKNTPTRSLSR